MAMKNGLVRKLMNGVYAFSTAGVLGFAALTSGVSGCSGDKVIGPDSQPPAQKISQTATVFNNIGINYTATLENLTSATRKTFRNDTLIDTKTITGPGVYSESLPQNFKGQTCFTLEAPNVQTNKVCATIADFAPVVYATIPKLYTRDTVIATIDSVVDINPEDNPSTVTGVTSLDGKVHPTLIDNSHIRLVSSDSMGSYSLETQVRTATGTANQAVITNIVSPDVIAFSSIIPGTGNNPPAEGPQIYTMALDGTGLTKLTSGIANISSEWSSDGMQIVYQNSGNGLYNIYIMNANGNHNGPIPRIPSTLNLDLMNPSLSPNGKEIVFAYDDYSNATGTGTVQGIGKFNLDGTGFVSLMSEPYSGHPPGNPKFSPNGTMISFEDFFHYGNYEILVIDSAGRNSNNPTNLTNNPGTDTEARWLPDGSGLVYVSDRTNPNFDVYEQKFQGNARNITTTGALAPDISPDGKKIIFARPNTPYLYLQNFDGTGPVDSVKTVGYAGFPSFRPRVR
ncbi:MAG: hypothetical protein ABSG05_00010 [Candidatus Pacearchaeota archaeon]